MVGTVRAFTDHGTGCVGLESAPAGLLMVIAFGDAYRVGIGSGPLRSTQQGFLIGAQSRFGRSILTGEASGVQVELPWSDAAAVFGPELADFADQAVSIGDLDGGAVLIDRLVAVPEERRTDVVRGWLRGRADTGRAPSPAINRALQRIDQGTVSVAQLASELGCSRTHLHRGVRAATGQPPSTLIRIARLHRLVTLRRAAPTVSLAQTAIALGFSDHAHLCHEAHVLAGRSPTALLADTTLLPDTTSLPDTT